MKICSKCKIEKDFSEFTKEKRIKCGLRSICKSCAKAYKKANSDKIKAYYEANRDKIKVAQRAYQKENRDKMNIASKAWAAANRDKVKVSNANYARNNRDIMNANAVKRRATKLQATAWGASQKAEIQHFYTSAKAIERISGCPVHVDHIIPLTNDLVCGLHVVENLQLLFAIDNLSKHNHFEIT